MSDPRFARLKTDPRFRRPKKQQSKVVVDDRFKEIFDDKRNKKGKGRVDKYGRAVSDTHERDNLKQFYRLENEDDGDEAGPSATPDYARGGVLLESSDEEDNESNHSDIVTLGHDHSKPISVPQQDEDVEIDLDEGAFADLDAQAAAYASKLPKEDYATEMDRTCRIAIVNLDWDHVRAIHLYKVFSSLVSPIAPATVPSTQASVHPNRQQSIRGPSSIVARGKVLSVRVYPSEFGKERMAREEKEGPPVDVFKKRKDFEDEDEINETNIYEVGGENDYDEDALRTYQLERLRYYYAIVTCDTVDAAAHIYSELEGTELERSANVFDLSFVPDGMSFDEECRDEALDDLATNYKGVDFVTDALRHSRVKLTWDEDDPERNHLTRRTFTKKEIDEADFKAYLASSTSGSENETDRRRAKDKGKKLASRDKLRALLLGGDDDELPEGWARGDEDGPRDIDMEITFTPGLSEPKDKDKDETTLEKYERKMKEKRRKRKDELKEKVEAKDQNGKNSIKDDFFDATSDDKGGDEDESENLKTKGKKEGRNRKIRLVSLDAEPHHESTVDELALIAASDNPNSEPKHFDLKAVMKAEKKLKGKGKREKRKKQDNTEDNEIQADFAIDVKDERFKALHEDHTFAIDPSNPQFKKTKSMTALLSERAKRQNVKAGGENDGRVTKKADAGERSLSSLVESVKRKSAAIEQPGNGKRRKV